MRPPATSVVVSTKLPSATVRCCWTAILQVLQKAQAHINMGQPCGCWMTCRARFRRTPRDSEPTVPDAAAVHRQRALPAARDLFLPSGRVSRGVAGLRNSGCDQSDESVPAGTAQCSGLDLPAQLGEQERAIFNYSRAIRSSPDYTLAYLNRGLAYLNTGRYERAIEDFNEVLRRDAHHPQAGHYRQLAEQRRQVAGG